MQRVDIGVDPGAPGDLQAALKTALDQQAQFLVTPIVHPRYRRLMTPQSTAQPRRAEPLTRSDLLLHSGQWCAQILGKLSTWLQLDSPHEAVRKRGEAAFRQEVQFASHLALAALLLPAPGPRCVNYAHCINQSLASYPGLQLWVRVLLSPPAPTTAASAEGEAASTPGASASWECWNRLRVLCEAHVAVGAVLELGPNLPEDDDEIERWCVPGLLATAKNTKHNHHH